VRPHQFFHREEDDLYAEVPVPFHIMALGGTFKVEGPAGPIEVNVSASSANGSTVSFRGKGMPSVSGHGRGALHVRLVVDVPKRLTKEQKKLIDQLGKITPEAQIEPRSLESDGEKPFFEKVRDLFG